MARPLWLLSSLVLATLAACTSAAVTPPPSPEAVLNQVLAAHFVLTPEPQLVPKP